MQRLRLDGVTVGDAYGRLWEVFDPPWWRLDRWVRWCWPMRRRVLPDGRQDPAGERGRIWLVSAEGRRQVWVRRSPVKLATVPEFAEGQAELHDWGQR